MGWERDIESGKPGCRKQTAKEAKVDTADIWSQRVEVGTGARPPRKSPPGMPRASTKHGKGIQDRAVADEIKNGVDPFPFRNAAREIGTFARQRLARATPTSRSGLLYGLWQYLCPGIYRIFRAALSKR